MPFFTTAPLCGGGERSNLQEASRSRTPIPPSPRHPAGQTTFHGQGETILRNPLGGAINRGKIKGAQQRGDDLDSDGFGHLLPKAGARPAIEDGVLGGRLGEQDSDAAVTILLQPALRVEVVGGVAPGARGSVHGPGAPEEDGTLWEECAVGEGGRARTLLELEGDGGVEAQRLVEHSCGVGENGGPERGSLGAGAERSRWLAGVGNRRGDIVRFRSRSGQRCRVAHE
jgi:hypothetical protein